MSNSMHLTILFYMTLFLCYQHFIMCSHMYIRVCYVIIIASHRSHIPPITGNTVLNNKINNNGLFNNNNNNSNNSNMLF